MIMKCAIRWSRFVGAFVIAAVLVLAVASFASDDKAGPAEKATARTKMERFRDTMRQRLDTVEGQVKSVKATVRTESVQAEKSLREGLDDARRKLHAQKEHLDKVRASLKARAQERLAETEEAVSEWKAKRETQKLNARADRAEAYAAAAIDHAAAAIDEAEEAILYALVARHDADRVQSEASAPR